MRQVVDYPDIFSISDVGGAMNRLWNPYVCNRCSVLVTTQIEPSGGPVVFEYSKGDMSVIVRLEYVRFVAHDAISVG